MPKQENNEKLNRVIDKRSLVVVQKFMTDNFTARKLTDTPTDDLEMVNRKYTNLNGTTANRPTTSILGQQYFDITIGRPLFNNGTTWVDGAGSIS